MTGATTRGPLVVSNGHLDQRPRRGDTQGVPRRWLWIILAVIAIVIAVYLVGYVIFDTGDDGPPATGTGDVITEPSP